VKSPKMLRAEALHASHYIVSDNPEDAAQYELARRRIVIFGVPDAMRDYWVQLLLDLDLDDQCARVSFDNVYVIVHTKRHVLAMWERQYIGA